MNETRDQSLCRLRPPLTNHTWEGWDFSEASMRQLASLQVQALGAYAALATEYEDKIRVLEAQTELDKECFAHLSKRGIWPRIVAYWKGTP